jgi:hypothetical protein
MQVTPLPDAAKYPDKYKMAAPNLFNLLDGLNAALDTFVSEGSSYYHHSHMIAI